MTDCCATCRHWASDDKKAGLCRRFPPTPIMIGFTQPSIVADPTKAQATPAIMSYFPQMMAFGHCGEFAPRLAS
jgi:hypothetical protein